MWSTASDWLRQPRKMLIDGAWVDARDGGTFETIDPATGTTLAVVARGRARDIDDAVAAARRTFERGIWRNLSGDDRSKVLWRVADLLESNADILGEVEVRDNGMPRAMATGGVSFAAEAFRFFAGQCARLYGHTSPVVRNGITGFAYSIKEPVGVVGLITPWNAPLIMAAWKLAPALAAGCSCVLKPPETTPLTPLMLGEILIEAGVPAGVVNIVPGFGSDAGDALTHHDDVDKISFTGSTATGKRIVAAAAGNLKRLTLELGGKSPFILFDDADIERAIPAAAYSIYANTGQVCAAGSRLLVQRKSYDRVVEAVARFAGQMKVGNGMDPSTQMGPLVSAAQLDRVSGYIASGRDAGAEVVTGGGRIGDVGYFVEPTIFAGTTADMRVVREEIFGPVLAISPFDDEEEAVAMANDTVYGLASFVWSENHSRVTRVAQRIRAGLVWVNTSLLSGYEFGFGGYRQSGWGRENGPDGISAFLETKSVVSQIG